MADATSGFGTLLKEGDAGSPEAFTAIAEVRSLLPTLESSDVSDYVQRALEHHVGQAAVRNGDAS